MSNSRVTMQESIISGAGYSPTIEIDMEDQIRIYGKEDFSSKLRTK